MLGVGCTVDTGFGPAPAAANTPAAAQDPAYVATTLAELVGSFDLTMVDGSSSFLGAAYGRVHPIEKSWVLSRKDNGCALYESQAAFCDPGCTGERVCADEHVCVPPPTPQNLGAIHLSGVGADALTMSEVDGQYQPNDSLPEPPCADGDPLQLDVDGAALPGFTLTTTCVGALKFDAAIKYVRKAPLKLTWSSLGSGRIRVRIDLGLVASTRGYIQCDVDDNGTLTVAADQMELLIKLGAASTPTITMTRIAAGGAEVGDPRNVAFTMRSSIARTFAIPDVTCAVNADCPTMKTCHTDMLCH